MRPTSYHCSTPPRPRVVRLLGARLPSVPSTVWVSSDTRALHGRRRRGLSGLAPPPGIEPGRRPFWRRTCIQCSVISRPPGFISPGGLVDQVGIEPTSSRAPRAASSAVETFLALWQGLYHKDLRPANGGPGVRRPRRAQRLSETYGSLLAGYSWTESSLRMATFAARLSRRRALRLIPETTPGPAR
jgi:hypothetical protein